MGKRRPFPARLRPTAHPAKAKTHFSQAFRQIPLMLLKMDLQKISSLVFSAGQRKLPEIVSPVSFNFVLYVPCDENKKKGSAFLLLSNNVAELSPRPLSFLNITVTQARPGPAKRNKIRPTNQSHSHCPKVEIKVMLELSLFDT